VGGAYLIGLVAAVLLDRLRFTAVKGLLFMALLAPWAMPAVPTGLVWRWMLDRNYGITNHTLVRLGLADQPLEFVLDPWLALLGVTAAAIWSLYPIALIMLFARLQSVPDELYEAAKVDGASPWHEVRHIAIPALRVVSATLVLVLILFSIRQVTTVFVMTGGGPARETEVLALFTFLEAFQFHRLGTASAAAVVTIGLVLAIALIYLRVLLRKKDS
jgi:multiple sugar transport system permease protein